MSAILSGAAAPPKLLARNLGGEPTLAVPTAAERLELSRARMRQAMRSPAPSQARGAAASTADPAMSWINSLRTFPGASVVIDAVQAWWLHHPVRMASLVAAEAATSLARPMAQRHPLQLVFCAFAVGALFSWSRPWRWLLKPALFAGLLPQLVSKVMTVVPPRTWMGLINTFVQNHGTGRSRPLD